MKRLLMILLVAFAIPATAFAAISGSGGGTTIANGQATLVSNSTNPYSFISFDDLNGQPVANLTDLSANVASASAYGGGSPRFSVQVSNGVTTKSIFVYLGTLPNFTSGGTGNTGNLLDDTLSGARVDSTQVGGPFYGTWSQAVSAATGSGYLTISNISVVADGGWAVGGSQTVVLDAVSIDGVVYDFTAPAKSDCKNGNWQALGYKNQGACVSFVETGK